MGAQGVGEGIPASRAEEMVPKFWDDGLLIVRAGGSAGMFSAICGGWLAAPRARSNEASHQGDTTLNYESILRDPTAETHPRYALACSLQLR